MGKKTIPPASKTRLQADIARFYKTANSRGVGRRGPGLPRRLAADLGFEVSLDATRRKVANDDAPGHEVMLRTLIRW